MKKDVEQVAQKLNKGNSERNVFYVCAPENSSDWSQFQTDLLKQMKDEFSYVKMSEDRADKYKVYKMIKAYDNEGKLIKLDWDNSFRS